MKNKTNYEILKKEAQHTLNTQETCNSLFLTERQWLKKGYVLKENAIGELDWNNCYHAFKVMRYDINNVVLNEEKAKGILKEINHERYVKYKDNKSQRQKRDAFLETMRAYWNTEYQWETYYNRRVDVYARYKTGAELNKKYNCCMFGSTYWYYHYNDTYQRD